MTDEIKLSDLPPPEPYDKARDEAQRARLMKVWEAPKGWRKISAVNNSLVGKWYLLVSFGFFTFAGILALMMRAQLAVPNNDLFSQELYNQLFTLHGTAMMFLFAVPIFEAVAILILPEILGARDLPFPRLSAFGFWCFVIGGVFVCGSIFFGVAPDGGWFMYPPLATIELGIGSDIWLLGLSFIEVASIAAAVEEQGKATQEIARNVDQASNGTQEVTNSITSVASAVAATGQAAGKVQTSATGLTEQSENLAGAVQHFLAKVRTGTDAIDLVEADPDTVDTDAVNPAAVATDEIDSMAA